MVTRKQQFAKRDQLAARPFATPIILPTLAFPGLDKLRGRTYCSPRASVPYFRGVRHFLQIFKEDDVGSSTEQQANRRRDEGGEPADEFRRDLEHTAADGNDGNGGDGGSDDLLRQVGEAREEARDLEDRMLRVAAEFENFKKRMQRERESDLKYAEENLLKELLPALDNLERAIEQGRETNDASALLAGVEMTYNGLRTTLEKFGLTPLAGKGEPFDPNFHEALAMEASPEAPANTILNEYQKGYMYKDRLLRAAKVVVSSGAN